MKRHRHWTGLMFLLSAPVWAATGNEITFETIAGILSGGSVCVTRLMLCICIIVGALFCVLSLVFYKIHRENPKIAPLGKPITYLVLGFTLIAIPFLGHYFGETGSVLEQRQAQVYVTYDIDAPLE